MTTAQTASRDLWVRAHQRIRTALCVADKPGECERLANEKRLTVKTPVPEVASFTT